MTSLLLTLPLMVQYISKAISTGCEKPLSIVTPIRLYLFGRVSNRARSKLGTSWVHAVRTENIRIHYRIYQWGPKNYAYEVIANESEKTICKVRGITLNYHASQLVNFYAIRAMIWNRVNPSSTCTGSVRSKATGRQGNGSNSDKPRGQVL